MPLNIHENDEFRTDEEDASRPPIKRSPQEKPSGPLFTTVTLVILLIAIVGSGVYLLYRYRVFAPKAPSTMTSAQQPALVDPWKSASPKPAVTEPAPPAASMEGRFAVYINSYRERSDAEEEVGRWIAAGFSSFVDDAQGWHRVAFGRYGDAQAARQDAERRKPSFENGYWVGPLK